MYWPCPLIGSQGSISLNLPMPLANRPTSPSMCAAILLPAISLSHLTQHMQHIMIGGGYSLYKYDSHPAKIAGRAVMISFDRPYIQDYGSGYVLSFEVNAIRWLERQGYDLSYMSSVDLHEDPSELLH